MEKNIKSNKPASFNLNEVFTLLKRILLIMLLFSVSRLGFYFFNIEHFPDLTFSRLLRILGGGLKFDISAVMYINSLYMFLFLLPFFFRYNKIYKNILKYLFFITNGIALAVNTMDFFYFDFILKRSTADVFMFAGEGNILTLFGLFLVDYWQGIIFWSVLIFIMIFFYNKTDIHKNQTLNKAVYYVSGTLWFMIIIYFSIIAVRGGFTRTTRPISLNNAGKYTEKPLEMAIVLNTPFTLIRTINKKPLKLKNYFPEDKLSEIYSPVHKSNDSTEFKNYNVVVLIIESMGKEYIGALNKELDAGKYSGYTPFLDSLMKKSKTFTRAFANGRKSIDALPSVTASIPSMVNPYVTSKYATNKINSLAGLLRDKAYETAFFHGAPNGSMGFESFMKVAGYNKYFGMSEYGNDADFDGSWGIWDEEFFQFFADELNKMKEPFHASIFSTSSHHPFKIPEKYKGKFKEGPLEIYIPVQYTDMALKKFFAKVSKMPWYENTIFVITADHCNQSYYDKYKTSIGSFSIPLIFFQPNNVSLRGFDSTVVQQMDIMPSVLNLLNFDKEYISFGTDVFDTEANHFAVNYNNNTYQIIKGDYVLQFRDDEVIAVYDYINDPLLTKNLAGKTIDIQTDMTNLIKAFIQQYNYRMINNELTIK
ncbi:MAG: sulfatase-like hydrolase/transferase [Bacteroidales bacterium]|nr:sulfatase-like hydrolase/transferase [Bacteroidales bacterium]